MTKDQISELQGRIAYLEGRVATLEQRRYYDYPILPYIPTPSFWKTPDYAYWDDQTTVGTSIGGATLAVT